MHIYIHMKNSFWLITLKSYSQSEIDIINISYSIDKLLSYSVQQNPFCETDSRPVSEEILRLWWNPKVISPVVRYCHRYISEDEFSPHPDPIILRLILILSSHLRLGLPSNLLFHVLRLKLCMYIKSNLPTLSTPSSSP